MKSSRAVTIAFVAVVLLIAVITIALLKFGFPSLAYAAVSGFAASFLYILIGYLSIQKAFEKSTVKFYRLFFIGLASRVLLFIIALYLVYRFVNIPLLGFVLSFIGFYVVFQVFEIHFIWQKLKTQTNSH